MPRTYDPSLLPWAVYNFKGEVLYIGLHGDEDCVWRTYLGWPSPSEIDHWKSVGLTVDRVSVTRGAKT